MSRWFRMYDDALDDEKINLLSDKSFRGWFKILCIASKNDGILPDLPKLAFRLRISEEKTSLLLDELYRAQLIDEVEMQNGPMTYTPHNWDRRQFKSDVSTERVKQHRKQKRNVSSAVSETPPETENRNREQRTEKKDAREAALFAAMQAFWSIWPNKVGKPAAVRALRSAIERATISEICEGVERYIRDKPPDRPWLNPATFLNQNRWEDQPARVETNGKTGNLNAALNSLVNFAHSGFGGAAPEEHISGRENGPDVELIPYRRS